MNDAPLLLRKLQEQPADPLLLMQALQLCQEADAAYYSFTSEDLLRLTDSMYDRLKTALRQAVSAPLDSSLKVAIIEYLRQVGNVPAVGKTVDLPYTLGSLDNAFPETIASFLEKKTSAEELIGSFKLDGQSLYAAYKNTKPVFAASRGTHTVGTDKTAKAQFFLKPIKTDEEIHIRGEVLLTGDAHRLLGYKNRRNGVIGLLNRDEHTSAHLIVPMFYELISPVIETEEERLRFLEAIGLPTVPWKKFNMARIFDELTEFYLKKFEQSYDCDGVVLTWNRSHRENVTHPSQKIAYKVNQSGVDTIVKDIEASVTRFGNVVPVLKIEPVEIGGVEVKNVSMFNFATIEQLQVFPGARIRVTRTGDVIPYLTDVIEPAAGSVPSVCPDCGTTLSWVGLNLSCGNAECPTVVHRSLVYYVEKLDVRDLKSGTIQAIGISSIQELHSLTEERLCGIPKIGDKKLLSILLAVEKLKQLSEVQWLTAVGIPACGQETSALLLEHWPLTELLQKTAPDLQQLDGIGEKTAETLIRSFPKVQRLLDELTALGVTISRKTTPKSEFLGNVTVTGTMSVDRKRFAAYLTSLGFKVSGVSAKTKFVVAGSKPTIRKVQLAESLGVPVINENEVELMTERCRLQSTADLPLSDAAREKKGR